MTVSKSSKDRTDAWFGAALLLLAGSLFVANGLTLETYTLGKLIQSIGKVAAGWLAYLLIFRKVALQLPAEPEKFEHLMGVMSLVLVVFLWRAAM